MFCNSGYGTVQKTGNSFCLKNNCTCLNGIAADSDSDIEQVVCELNGKEQCVSCASAYELNENGFCQFKICDCENGIGFLGEGCAEHLSFNCEECNGGYKLTNANLCEKIPATDPCDYYTCENDGNCVLMMTGKPSCNCNTGWTGKYCEHVHQCSISSNNSSSPCLHSGICVDPPYQDLNSFIGSDGNFRLLNRDGEKYSESDLLDGNFKEFNCKCNEGFTGNVCEHVIQGSCRCENGESLEPCKIFQNDQCGDCDSGYHLNGLECDLNQCFCNNGRSTNGSSGCFDHGTENCANCNSGYGNETSFTTVYQHSNDFESNPIPTLNGTCSDINECDFENKCTGGGCINLPGTYKCDCYYGFTGDDCGTEVSCRDNPCDLGIYPWQTELAGNCYQARSDGPLSSVDSDKHTCFYGNFSEFQEIGVCKSHLTEYIDGLPEYAKCSNCPIASLFFIDSSADEIKCLRTSHDHSPLSLNWSGVAGDPGVIPVNSSIGVTHPMDAYLFLTNFSKSRIRRGIAKMFPQNLIVSDFRKISKKISVH